MAEVEFYGEKFELRTGKIKAPVLMKFARAISSSSSDGGFEDMATLHWLLQEHVVAEKDWRRFWHLAEEKVDDDISPFFSVIQARMEAPIEAATDRPTVQPSDSSDGHTDTEPKSETPSVVTVLAERYPDRPDLWMGLTDMAEARQTG